MEEQKHLLNDATDKVKGFLYQFYIALKYCFELNQNEKLFIEKFGDVTIDNLSQIEVKDYNNPLTDAHDNLWNTLYNWCSDSFDAIQYKNLILLTTQQIGKKSKLNGWNNKNMTDKLSVIISIAQDYCEKNKEPKTDATTSKIRKMSKIISDENQEKLKTILDKFTIIDCAEGFEDVFENIKTKYAKHIPEFNQEQYLNGLLGFVINPKIVKDNWEISFEMFSNQLKILTGMYHAQTVVFPKRQINFSDNEIQAKKDSLFVNKITAIGYDAVEIGAIHDFLTANNLFLTELAEYKMQPNIIMNYERELLASFDPRKRQHYRKVSNVLDLNKVISESQDLYDEVTGEAVQPFVNYNDTSRSFRNGFYHIMADEPDEKITWLLKDVDNDKKN